jgi:hypothetical protein
MPGFRKEAGFLLFSRSKQDINQALPGGKIA